jgi:DNA-formamidopyrimidine glycosylase
MPEGPEVKRMADVLNNRLQKLYLLKFDILEGSRYIKNKLENYDIFDESLPLKLIKVYSIAKKIIFEFEQDVYIINEPRMEGHWYWKKIGKHTNHVMRFGYISKGIGFITDEAFFDDTRHFGVFTICNGNYVKEVKESLGPDVLNDEIDINTWLKAFERVKGWEICKALMDQSVISGIGNYLKSEILYKCKIAPNRKVRDITEEEHRLLMKISIETIKLSYKNGGLSFATYKDPDGKVGTFDVLVYQREFDKDGNVVVRDVFTDGRSTYWVNKIQK